MHLLKSPITLVLLGGFTLLSSLCLATEQKQPLIRPTFAQDAVAKVARGGDVEITLQAIPSYGHEIVFRILRQPLHGVLSNLHTTSDHSASVTYHHDGSKTPLEDEFSFRAQARGQSVSEPSDCRITIVPPPASLVFEPPLLDFGRVMLSAKKQMTVKVINQGGEVAEGRLILPKGFSVPMGERYRLSEGMSNTTTIQFDPMEERQYVGQAVTQPCCEKRPLELRGEGIARFDVLKISGLEWEVRNLGDLPILISCTGGEGWILPREFSVPPHDSHRLTFQRSDEADRETNSVTSNAVVHLSDGLTEREIEMPPLSRFTPVIAQAVTSADLGKLPIGGTQKVTFSLINRSEYPKHLLWRAASPSGGGSDEANTLDLPGGGSREISFDWKPSLPGEATLTISVQEGHSTRDDLIWKASVLHSDTLQAAATWIQTSQDAGEGDASASSPQSSVVTPTKVTTIPSVAGAAHAVKRSWFGDDTIVLNWDSSGKLPSQFKLQEQGMVIEGPIILPKGDQGNPHFPKSRIVLTSIDMATATANGAEEVFKIQGMPPGWHHLVLSQFSKEGSLEAESHFQIHIFQKPSWWIGIRTPLGFLLICLLFLLLRNIRRR
jgi:hypothetical protein